MIHFLVPCEFDEWSEWSTCSQSCGGGVKTRTRKIKQLEDFGGAPCKANTTETGPCALNECGKANLKSFCLGQINQNLPFLNDKTL